MHPTRNIGRPLASARSLCAISTCAPVHRQHAVDSSPPAAGRSAACDRPCLSLGGSMPSIADLGNSTHVWIADPLGTTPTQPCSTGCPVATKSCWPGRYWAARDKHFYRVISRYYRVMDTGFMRRETDLGRWYKRYMGWLLCCAVCSIVLFTSPLLPVHLLSVWLLWTFVVGKPSIAPTQSPILLPPELHHTRKHGRE